MRSKIEAMLRQAQERYNSAAAMHAMSKVSYEGGRIDALKAVLALLD